MKKAEFFYLCSHSSIDKINSWFILFSGIKRENTTESEVYGEGKNVDIRITGRTVMTKELTAAEGDNNSLPVTFIIDRFNGGQDLSLCDCYIKLAYPDGETSRKKLSVCLSGEKLNADWKVDKSDTYCSGETKCQVCFENSDLSYVFASEIFILNVYDSVDADKSFDRNLNNGTYKDIENEIRKKQDKEEGKVLSSNDYTNAEKALVAEINLKENSLKTEYSVKGTEADGYHITIINNIEFYLKEISKLTVFMAFENIGNAAFLSFDSGSTTAEINFKYQTPLFSGVDCNNNIFIPVAGKHYEIIFIVADKKANGIVRIFASVNGWEI